MPTRIALQWLMLFGILGILAVGFYAWRESDRAAPQAPSAPRVTGRVEPQIRHPLPSAEGVAAPQRKALPPLAESDEALKADLAALTGPDWLALFHLDTLVRRFVVTVDNLPRKRVPLQYSAAKPVEGKFAVVGGRQHVALSPTNFRRYTPYVRLADSIDTKKLIATYHYVYPLLQEEYENQGYPNRYFNDRVVEAIDDLLAAPETAGSLALTQPKVLYEYAEPRLENLSAGQKIMVRMGPENATRVKAKLREIREAIATPSRGAVTTPPISK